ncbi:hypothetical protein AVEN_166248-1 [Araneus ventricosus]|uniref:CCHC-type domain-containing protein n=1 Tax=Araneus ventricosus TaxID=182803 RepID=A0A4Y2T6X7_ARAVE|nr:hypothetical protein AVEN_166248-1 [Araneus ventricosus]
MVIQSEVMNFIDNIPNKNLSKDNRKTLREYMMDFMSVVARQQVVMCMILGKCHEQTDLIEHNLEGLRSTNEESIKMNFSAATKIRSRSRSRSRGREGDEGKLVLLYPKKEGEKININKKLQETIDPAKIKVGIRNIKNLNKGGILIECAKEDEIDKLRAEVESNENLREDIVIRRPIKVRPNLIIYRVEEDLDIEESIVNLRDQNEELKEGDLKHEYIMKTNKGNHWIVSIYPETFQKIIKLGKVNLGWYRLRIREFIKRRQCFKCFRFGHIAKNCSKRDILTCMKCGEEGHLIKDCNKEQRCINCHNIKERQNLKLNLKHDV